MKRVDNNGQSDGFDIVSTVNNIYKTIKPTPVKYWTVVGSIPSEDIKQGVIRFIVRRYMEGEMGRAFSAHEFSSVCERLFDKLCYESIQKLVETDMEYSRMKKDGSIDRMRKEFEREAKEKTLNKGIVPEMSQRVGNWNSATMGKGYR